MFKVTVWKFPEVSMDGKVLGVCKYFIGLLSKVKLISYPFTKKASRSSHEENEFDFHLHYWDYYLAILRHEAMLNPYDRRSQ